MLQAEAERVECEPTYEPDDPIAAPRASRVTCATCDEPTERWRECETCGALLCPCCQYRDARGGVSCEECPGAHAIVVFPGATVTP